MACFSNRFFTSKNATQESATFGVRVAWLEQNQRRDTTIIWLGHVCYEEKLGLLSLEKKKFQKTVAAFQHFKGACKRDGDKSFSKICSERTRDNGIEIKRVDSDWT